jgi:hypothetical protein
MENSSSGEIRRRFIKKLPENVSGGHCAYCQTPSDGLAIMPYNPQTPLKILAEMALFMGHDFKGISIRIFRQMNCKTLHRRTFRRIPCVL